MNLQIRDPRAHELAQELAKRRNLSMTDAVIAALEAELRRDTFPLAARLDAIARELATHSTGNGRDMGRAEIDAMWNDR